MPFALNNEELKKVSKNDNFFWLIIFVFAFAIFSVSLGNLRSNFSKKLFDTYGKSLDASKSSDSGKKKPTLYSVLKGNVIDPLSSIILFLTSVITIFIVAKEVTSLLAERGSKNKDIVSEKDKENIFFIEQTQQGASLNNLVTYCIEKAVKCIRKNQLDLEDEKSKDIVLAADYVGLTHNVATNSDNLPKITETIENAIKGCNFCNSLGYFYDPCLFSVSLDSPAQNSVLKYRKIEQLNNNVNFCFALIDIIIYTLKELTGDNFKNLQKEAKEVLFVTLLEKFIKEHLEREVVNYDSTINNFVRVTVSKKRGLMHPYYEDISCQRCSNDFKILKDSKYVPLNNFLPKLNKNNNGHSLFYIFEQKKEIVYYPVCFKTAYALKVGNYQQCEEELNLLDPNKVKENMDEYFTNISMKANDYATNNNRRSNSFDDD